MEGVNPRKGLALAQPGTAGTGRDRGECRLSSASLVLFLLLFLMGVSELLIPGKAGTSLRCFSASLPVGQTPPPPTPKEWVEMDGSPGWASYLEILWLCGVEGSMQPGALLEANSWGVRS